ncbi:MAG: TRL-like family protein [Lentisphaeria bacterium]|nr:TRL-like family protein [Lentisphaeria bacterium]
MNKKKMMVLAGAYAAVLTMATGCHTAYVNNYGFGSTMPGIIYSAQTRGTFMLPKAENLDGVEKLGMVRGESSSINILTLVSIGDGGIHAAKMDALNKYPQADDIINVEADNEHTSILCFYNKSTTVLRGMAIKYKTGRKQ